MAQFTIAPEIFQRFPGLTIAVVIARDIANDVPRPGVAATWRTAWEQAAEQGAAYGNAQSHPHIRPWREAFQAQGISGKQFPSSAEALLRRALKGGEPFTINPVVDFYNAISLRYAVPAGAFDLGDCALPLELRLTREGERFAALDAAEPIPVSAGEVAYVDQREILTRHFVWRQARRGLVTPATRDVFFVSEVLGAVGRAVAEAVAHDLVAGAREHFGVAASPFLLDAAHLSAVWA